jgi:hypothetical protein
MHVDMAATEQPAEDPADALVHDAPASVRTLRMSRDAGDQGQGTGTSRGEDMAAKMRTTRSSGPAPVFCGALTRNRTPYARPHTHTERERDRGTHGVEAQAHVQTRT